MWPQPIARPVAEQDSSEDTQHCMRIVSGIRMYSHQGSCDVTLYVHIQQVPSLNLGWGSGSPDSGIS
jgi:hypothetical protein